jgi:hypothetical protein
MTPTSLSLAGIFVTENPKKKRQLGQIRARYLAIVDVLGRFIIPNQSRCQGHVRLIASRRRIEHFARIELPSKIFGFFFWRSVRSMNSSRKSQFKPFKQFKRFKRSQSKAAS